MSGSVFFVAAILVIGLALSVFASPLFLIPAVTLVLLALFAAPLFGAFRRNDRPGGSSGVPSTTEAAYDPVAEPTERGA